MNDTSHISSILFGFDSQF